MKKFLVLYILLLCISVDLFDGLPIQNAAVLAKMEKVTGSPTNEKGLYLFKVNAQDSILVSYSHPSYETL